jgi:glycosyltransferase involved in cell wall biosynthesis
MVAGVDVPEHLWDYSASLQQELRRIRDVRRVDVVHVPNWDSEGVAVLLSGEFTVVVGLHTPLETVRSLDPRMNAEDPAVGRMAELERLVYTRAGGLLASGRWVVDEIERRYAVSLDEDRLGFAAHGLPDLEEPGRSAGDHRSAREPDEVRLLFVGRLEPRKGVDTLLDSVPALLAEFPALRVSIVGDDRIPAPGGGTYRQRFEASHAASSWADRVEFTGSVDDEELARRYRGCDLFVAPSRYESFGLVLIEAMMRSKPVVACAAGGMREIVEEGGSGFLVPPGDSDALRARVAQLISSTELRARLGRRGREIYEERYTAARMVRDVTAYYRHLLGTRAGERADGKRAVSARSGEPA